MKVFWASVAEQDRADIIEHISQDSRLAAIRMDALFAEATGRLANHPHLGKAGQIPGTRELIPHESYRLVYEVRGEIVWILALVAQRLCTVFVHRDTCHDRCYAARAVG